MEVIKNCSAYLSNYEVLDLIQNVKCYNKQVNQLATITFQTKNYLKDTACVNQTPEKIKKFMKAIEPFKLTKSEKLTLLNLCPTTPLEIQLIVEESEDRLTEEDVNAILQVVKDLQKVEVQDEQGET